MALIVLGILAVGYGLLPTATVNGTVQDVIAPPEDAPLLAAHWKLMGMLTVALIIVIMKPASLGFVTPGMRVVVTICVSWNQRNWTRYSN